MNKIMFTEPCTEIIASIVFLIMWKDFLTW